MPCSKITCSLHCNSVFYLCSDDAVTGTTQAKAALSPTNSESGRFRGKKALWLVILCNLQDLFMSWGGGGIGEILLPNFRVIRTSQTRKFQLSYYWVHVLIQRSSEQRNREGGKTQKQQGEKWGRVKNRHRERCQSEERKILMKKYPQYLPIHPSKSYLSYQLPELGVYKLYKEVGVSANPYTAHRVPSLAGETYFFHFSNLRMT